MSGYQCTASGCRREPAPALCVFHEGIKQVQRGEERHRDQLSAETIRQILTFVDDGYMPSAIATLTGLDRNRVWNVLYPDYRRTPARRRT